jgi:hypothetical protein
MAFVSYRLAEEAVTTTLAIGERCHKRELDDFQPVFGDGMLNLVVEPMPRFFFHIHFDDHVQRDSDGIELPSLDTAVAQAHQARVDIMTEDELGSGSKLLTKPDVCWRRSGRWHSQWLP